MIRNHRYWATVRLDGNTFTVKLVGAAQYTSNSEREAVAEHDLSDTPAPEVKAVRGALNALLAKHQSDIALKVNLAAAEALTVAAKRGELS